MFGIADHIMNTVCTHMINALLPYKKRKKKFDFHKYEKNFGQNILQIAKKKVPEYNTPIQVLRLHVAQIDIGPPFVVDMTSIKDAEDYLNELIDKLESSLNYFIYDNNLDNDKNEQQIDEMGYLLNHKFEKMSKGKSKSKEVAEAFKVFLALLSKDLRDYRQNGPLDASTTILLRQSCRDTYNSTKRLRCFFPYSGYNDVKAPTQRMLCKSANVLCTLLETLSNKNLNIKSREAL